MLAKLVDLKFYAWVEDHKSTWRTLSQLWSFKICHSNFLAYKKSADLLIFRLWNCERAGREGAFYFQNDRSGFKTPRDERSIQTHLTFQKLLLLQVGHGDQVRVPFLAVLVGVPKGFRIVLEPKVTAVRWGLIGPIDGTAVGWKKSEEEKSFEKYIFGQADVQYSIYATKGLSSIGPNPLKSIDWQH